MRHLKVISGIAWSFSIFSRAIALAWLAALPGGALAASLKPETRAAFERYVQLTDQRNAAELSANHKFLWIDSLDPLARQNAYQSLDAGALEISQRETLNEGKPISCPNGLIHHWIGLIFVRGVTLDEVLHTLQDYNHHAVYYGPDVQQSRIESRDGAHFRVFMRFRRTEVITVVIDTVNDIQYFRDSPDRARSRSSAIRVNEVENPGARNEREDPAGQDDGFLWGMETWWRMEEKNGGVYIQSEVVSLTRDIPSGLGWLVGPFVNSIPKESLTFTLQATRRAVLSAKLSGEIAAAGEQVSPD
ncbi:MAG TPA: hypothetical protein VLV88_04635 [Terriglobales bacterium]|nr:hypothetical protein [Terriglobales bacterium]